MSPTRKQLLWSLALVPVIWSMSFTRSMGSDLWWHIASGDWMRQIGGVVKTDPFSFTFYGKEWIHHEWLGDILLSFWVEYWGKTTLVYWKWGLIMATFLLLFRVSVNLSEGGFFWPAISVGLAAGAAAPYLDIRPQLYTFLGYAIVLNLFWAKGKARWLIPPLVAVWVNLHGGFIFALMSLGILLLPEFVDQPEKRKSAVMLFLASTFATFLNPHGYHTTVFPFRYAFKGENPYTTLAEWLPPFNGRGFESRLFPFLMGLFLVVTVIWFASKHRPTDLRMLSALLLGILTLAMALKSRRFIILFAMSSTLILGPGLSLATQRWREKFPVWLGPLSIFLLGCVFVAPFPKGKLAFDYMVSQDQYPVDICDFMEVNQFEGKVFALYNYGGYLHLRGKGRWKVYIDGRADTVYDNETYIKYLGFNYGRPGGLKVLEEANPDFVIWPHTQRQVIQSVLKTGQWQVIYMDSIGVLLGRKEVDYSQVKDPPDSAYRLASEALFAILQKRLEEGLTYANRSLEIYPTVRAYELAIGLYKATEQPEKARELREKMQKDFPLDNWFVSFFRP